MGLEYDRLMLMTWADFDWHRTGYIRRVEREMDKVRHLIAGMYNSSGFSKRRVKATDVMQLPHLDGVNYSNATGRVPKETVERLLKLM